MDWDSAETHCKTHGSLFNGHDFYNAETNSIEIYWSGLIIIQNISCATDTCI